MAKGNSRARTGGGVCIGFVHPGNVSAYFTSGLTMAILHDSRGKQQITGVLERWASANISASRNEIVDAFLAKPECEWLLFIDSDMAFDLDSIARLVRHADKQSRPIVGGLCFGGSGGRAVPTLYQLVHSADGVPVTTQRMETYTKDDMIRVDATGAAFLLVHRRVYEAMRERGFNKTFPYFQETELGGLPCGEDITFCLRAGLLGFPIYVDASVKIGHHKSHLLDEALFDQQRGIG